MPSIPSISPRPNASYAAFTTDIGLAMMISRCAAHDYPREFNRSAEWQGTQGRLRLLARDIEGAEGLRHRHQFEQVHVDVGRLHGHPGHRPRDVLCRQRLHALVDRIGTLLVATKAHGG